MGDVQSAASRAGDASRLRLRLVLLLLLLIHGGYPSSSTTLSSSGGESRQGRLVV